MASVKQIGNSYHIMVSDGYDSNGKQKRRTMTWKPEEWMSKREIKEELQMQVAIFERRVKSGQVLDHNITFEEFVEKWDVAYAKPSLSPTTYRRYKILLTRILPEIGNIRMSKLQPNHLMSFYASLRNEKTDNVTYQATDRFIDEWRDSGITKHALGQEINCCDNTVYQLLNGKGICERVAKAATDFFEMDLEDAFTVSDHVKELSDKTISEYHRLIASILHQAVYWQVIVSNPADRVRPPRRQIKEAAYLDEEQALHLLDLLEEEPRQFQVMIKLLIYSGMRRGELLGLEWKDVNFKKRIITIRRTSQYTPDKGVFTKGTKTESSVRTIRLPDQAFEMLAEFKEWQNGIKEYAGYFWEDNDRLFTQADGKPLHPHTITRKFHEFIKESDLPNICLHSLRHTNITLMIAAGVPLRTVSYRAGHAQTSTTANIYSHVINSVDEMASEALTDIFTPNLKK